MSDTTTTNLGLTKPEDQASNDTWGLKLNADLNLIDAKWNSTVPSTQALGDAASAGTSLFVARADHKHAMPSSIGTADIASGSITSSKMALDNDFTVGSPGKGMILYTPDGLHTYRVAISNNGELTTEQIT